MRAPMPRRPLLSAAAAGLGLALAPLGRPAKADLDHPGADLDQIRAEGRIRIGTYRDNPPFSDQPDPSGPILGIDAGIARLIAAGLGVDLDLRLLQAGETTADDLRNYLWRGTAIEGAAATINLLLSIPYDRRFQAQQTMVVLTGQYARNRLGFAWDPAQIPDEAAALADWPAEAILAVETDSMADTLALGHDGGRLAGQIRHYRSARLAAEALLSGEAAGCFATIAVLEALIATRPERGLQVRVWTPEPGDRPLPEDGQWTLGLAVSARYRQLAYAVDDVIAAALADGRIPALFTEAGVTFRPPPR